MKIYFGTSPKVKKRFPRRIDKIYNLISKLGYRHTSNWIKEVDPDKFYKLSTKEINEHHRQTINEVRQADICVFEISLHSLSVGYLIKYALDLNKPVIALSQALTSPAVFREIKSDRLFFVVYKNGDLGKKLEKILKKASEQLDVRFNFFITPPLLAYLDWIANRKRIPRSVYLRSLIESDMKKNEEYYRD